MDLSQLIQNAAKTSVAKANGSIVPDRSKMGVSGFLTSLGQPADFQNREKLYGSVFRDMPTKYTGSVEQNSELKNALQGVYGTVGGSIGVRPQNDPLRQFAERTTSKSVYEGNKYQTPSASPLSSLEPTLANQNNPTYMRTIFHGNQNPQNVIRDKRTLMENLLGRIK